MAPGLTARNPGRCAAKPKSQRWPELACATICGGVLATSVLAEPRPVIAFAFAPALVWLLERAPASPRRGFALGLAAGFGCNVVAFHWLVGLFQDFASFPLALALPTMLLFAAAQGIAFGLGGALIESCRRASCEALTAAPFALTFAMSATPSLFPWRISTSMVGWLPWAQAADLGGAPLLDVLVAGAGCAIVAALRAPSPKRVLLAGLLLLGPLGYGEARLRSVRAERAAAPPVRVGVVQPNLGIPEKADHRLDAQHLRSLQRETRALEREGADVVVWPETAYPFPFPRGRGRDRDGSLAALGGRVRGPLLMGALTVGGVCERWNSVLAIDRRGRVRGVSDKVELLHFGETVPLWHELPMLRTYFRCPGLKAGTRTNVLELDSVRYGVLNCYEDVLPEHARIVMARSPDVLINVTNDAWFGDTAEPHLHDMVARLRSIETRRDLIRAVNTGVSSHTAATGEALWTTATWTPARFVADARRGRGRTLWVRLGDWVSPACALVLLMLVVRNATRRARADVGSSRSTGDRHAPRHPG